MLLFLFILMTFSLLPVLKNFLHWSPPHHLSSILTGIPIRKMKVLPMRIFRGPLRIPLPSMPGSKTLCGIGAEPEDSSPVLTWILRYFWSLPRGVSPRLEWGHARALSSRSVAAVSRFPSRGSRDQGLSVEDFPRGFPTRLSHRAVPRATVV